MRQYYYNLLEKSDSGAKARLVSFLLMLLIICNVMAVILASDSVIYTELQLFFDRFELFSIVVFSIEYFSRVWVCVEDPRYQSSVKGRLKYMVSPMAIVDFVAILPFYLGMFFTIDTRFLRVLRLFRLFKLSRHFSAMSVLLKVIKNEMATLLSAIFILLVLIVLASAGMFLVEHSVQPEAFGTIPRAMWWASITLTTVGYGDVVPVTVAGRILGAFITILGVGMAALPAGIIASGFTMELNKRRDTYRTMVRDALSDGVVDHEEHRVLRDYSQDMGIEHEEAMSLLKQESAAMLDNSTSLPDRSDCCPHCGKPVTKDR
jgi:voltage-gated potassium channel